MDVRVVCDAARPGPGQKFHLAVVFKIQPKWHIYWKDPGEGAMAPRIKVSAPRGFEVGATLWPRPVTVRGPVGPEHCYFDEAVLFVPVTAPPDLTTKAMIDLEVQVDWAVCKEVCRIGSARRSLQLETSQRPADPAEPQDPLLAAWWRRLPAPLADLPGATISFDGAMLRLAGPARGRATAGFLPAATPGVSLPQAAAVVWEDRFRIEVPVEVQPQNAEGPMSLGGLVVLGDGPDEPCYDFELPIEAPPAHVPGGTTPGEGP